MQKYYGLDNRKMLLKIDNEQKRYKNLKSYEKWCMKAWSIWQLAEYQEQQIAESIKPARSITGEKIIDVFCMYHVYVHFTVLVFARDVDTFG